MIQKNKEREERKTRRKAPIPYARKEASRDERKEKKFEKVQKSFRKLLTKQT